MKTSTNKTGFRASSHDVAKIRNLLAVGGDVDVSYSVAPNAMPASQEAAPYLGHARVAGACSQDELAEDMVKAGCQMNVEEIKRVWNGCGTYLLDRMPASPRAYDLGFVRVWPVIGGTFPASDAEFDKDRNEVYVTAAPSAAVRNALSGGTPTAVGTPPDAVVIENVQREHQTTANTIRSGEPFWILGRNLTICYGGEHAELALPDGGGTVPVTLEAQTADDGSQRIVGRLVEPVDACEGATLTLWTRGNSPESDLRTASSDALTVLAGEPPAPTTPTVTAINEGTFWAGSSTVHGTDMKFADAHPASHIVLKNGEGQAVTGVTFTDEGTASETAFGVIVADNEGTLADGVTYTFEFAMVDSQGNPVTVTQTARYVSE